MSEKIKGMFGNPERAEEVRNWLLSQGAKENKQICKCGSNIYFVRTNGVVDFVDKTFAELFDIVELQPQHEFKPFDRVLVRDSVIDEWIPSLYSSYRENFKASHATIGGGTWKLCIPYEGNEHLAGAIKIQRRNNNE